MLWTYACIALMAASAAPAPKPLAILKPELRQYEGGPVTPGAGFFPGETVFLQFQVSGYAVSEDSRIALRYQIEAVDPHDVPLIETVRNTLAAEVSAEDKDWRPIVRGSVQVPPIAQPGTYRIRAVVEDTLSKQTARIEIPFTVGGRAVAPAETLAARDFRFLRGEEDRDPLTQPVYHPGDSLWARFEIVGFRYGPNHAVRVDYGIAMIGPAGNTLYSQAEAAAERSESFYPVPYVPGAFSLRLDQNVKPGEYTLVLTLHDEVGNQNDESRHVFRIE